MAENIQLDRPELGVQHEKGPYDPYLRNFLALRHYAHINGFEDRLDQILRQAGGEELADIGYTGSEEELSRIRELLPKLRRAVDKTQVELRGQVRQARKGVAPMLDAVRYQFVTHDGRHVYFKLDPDANANDTLHRFEQLVADLPGAEEIEAQFMPIFQQIRRKMEFWGWDKEKAGPQATLLTIKQLCDCWAVD